MTGWITAALAFAAPSGAVAAVELGRVATSTPTGLCKPPPEGSGILYDSGSTVPAGGGVITRIRTASSTPGTIAKFRVVRPSTARTVGEAAYATIAAGGEGSATARIPVQAGDRIAIGAAFGSTGNVPCVGTGDGQTVTLTTVDDHGDDEPVTARSENTATTSRANVAATLEPDADADGFGDDSQDGCPSDAARRGPCDADLSVVLAAVGPAPVAGGVQVLRATVAAAPSRGEATGVRLASALPEGVELVAATASQGSCAGTTLDCGLGRIEPGGSASAIIVVRALTAGIRTMRATASSAEADAKPADNAGEVRFEVGAAPPVVVPPVTLPGPSTPTPAEAERCRIPRLVGLSLQAARTALRAARCAPGRVARPKRVKKGARLRVRSQAIPAGLEGPVGTKVGVRLQAVRPSAR